jgi:uncharacterized Ntn-hydrolase superfamily protein
MRWLTPLLAALLLACASAPLPMEVAPMPSDPAPAVSPRRPVSTYSIVARDPRTGEIGVAVQSHWFSVGSIVTWAEAGVGAVATQSFAEPAYGPRGLDLMRSGVAAPDALRVLLGADDAAAVRQIAFIDAAGRVAAHTGDRCIDAAGHKVGRGYSVQANMMQSNKVVPAMARAFEGSRGKLPERLLAALAAAEKAGGDVRGKQSAAILVVSGKSSGRPWADRVVELRIEDHPDPVAELDRLLELHRAYEHMNAGDAAVEEKKMAAALRHYRAASKLAPKNIEMVFWHAVALATNGRVPQSIPLFRRAFAADKSWMTLTRRLLKPGIIPDTPAGRKLVERILAEAAP